MADTQRSQKEYRSDTGYADEARRQGSMTPATEDYLEMIYRLSKPEDSGKFRHVRISELSEHLNVAPSSASRMARSMSLAGFVDFKRYGYITLTPLGIERGAYLISRHRTVLAFLSKLRPGDSLEEAERIEHYLSPETVAAMEMYLASHTDTGTKSE